MSDNGGGVSWNVMLKIMVSAFVVAAFGWAVTNAAQIQTNTRALAVHEIKITNLEFMMRESTAVTDRRLSRIEAKLDELLDRRQK